MSAQSVWERHESLGLQARRLFFQNQKPVYMKAKEASLLRNCFCTKCDCFQQGELDFTSSNARKLYYSFKCNSCQQTSQGFILTKRSSWSSCCSSLSWYHSLQTGGQTVRKTKRNLPRTQSRSVSALPLLRRAFLCTTNFPQISS